MMQLKSFFCGVPAFLGNIHKLYSTTLKGTPSHVFLQHLYVGVEELSEITKKALCEVLLAQALVSGLVSTSWIHIHVLPEYCIRTM